ncbi:MAG: AfsR/SARP family transcriptional regulator [Nitriliruptoraceae bacterium]
MEIDLLGPPRARLGARVLELTGRQPALLAVLALEAPRPVSHDRLIDAIWGEDLPRDPANALQQRISSLRRSLDPDRAGQVLATLSGGYALHVDAARIDARRFTHLAATGHDQLAKGQHDAARHTLTEALSLWRGPALDGVADEPWARAEVARLTELELNARQDRLRAELALGAGPELVAELTDLTAAHPLHEGLVALQLVALVRADRQAAALGAYERLREALADELGVDPGLALQRLHQRVLQQDPSLLAPDPADGAASPLAARTDGAGPPLAAPADDVGSGVAATDRPAGPGGTAPAATDPAATTPAATTPAATAPTTQDGRGATLHGNVPAAATSVLGRDEEVTRLAAQLSGGTRLVTLTGPGGAGKTTLAQAVVRALAPPADGTWLVALAPLPAGGEVADTVARTLGIQPVGLSQPSVDAASLAAALADRELVLVLDNAEHVVEATALLAGELLARAPAVRLLVTSRELLRVPGEQAEAVPPLREDAALELLTERARARSPGFRLDDDDRAVAARLVRQLDLLPLAIELAASRLAVLSLAELAAQVHHHLDPRVGAAAAPAGADGTGPARTGTTGPDQPPGALDLLTSATRGAPARQKTLRGALDWSHDLLDPELQRAWAALSVPPGAFDLQMAAALLEAAGVAGHHLDVVGELADRSLLQVDTTSTPTRLELLGTIRAYGRDRLATAPWRDAVRRRHAAAVEAALVAATTDPDPARYPLDLEAMAAWRDDARAAMAWADAAGDHGQLQRLAGLLGWSWVLHGLAAEGLDWLARGLPDIEVAEAASGVGTAVVLDPDAVVWASGLRTARPDAEALRWARLSLRLAETPQQRVTAAVFAAAHLLRAGGTASFTEAWEEATATAEPIGGWPLGFVRLMGAQLARMSGAVDRVRPQAEEALALLEASGADWAEAYAIDLVIEGVLEDGDHRRARELALRGLARCRTAGSPELEARMLLQLGVATHHLGEPAQGRELLDRAITMIRRTTGITDDDLGGADPTSLAFAELMAGVLARERAVLAAGSPDPDELARADGHLARAAALFAPTGNAYGAAWTAAERAHTAVAAGKVETARGFAAEAVALADEVGQPELLAQARAAEEAAGG